MAKANPAPLIGRRYSLETIESCFQLFARGRTLREIADAMNLHYTTLRGWSSHYKWKLRRDVMLGRHAPVEIKVPSIISRAGSDISAVDSPLEKQRLELQARELDLQERRLELRRNGASPQGRTDADSISPSSLALVESAQGEITLQPTPVPETFEAQQTAYATGSAREAIRMLDAIRSTPTTDLVRQADKIHKLDATARKALALEEHKPAVIVNVGLLSAIADRTLNKAQVIDVEQIAEEAEG